MSDAPVGGSEGAAVAVLAPVVYLSITVEAVNDGGDDIHLHAGGQGIWIARMLRQLGTAPSVCAPIGGESGQALSGLVRDWRIQLRSIATSHATPVYVHDRRSGERHELARSRPEVLNRHETDELYHCTLQAALETGTCVVTAPEPDAPLPDDFFRRLGADLATAHVATIGDLHGDALAALLEGGPLAALKIGEQDLVEDALLPDTQGDAGVLAALDDFHGRGVHTVIVSRGDRPSLARCGDATYEVSGPLLDTVDTTGSGDSMTAAVATGVTGGLPAEELLRRAWAAGAANVTRRGLGSGNPALIEQLARRVHVRRLERS